MGNCLAIAHGRGNLRDDLTGFGLGQLLHYGRELQAMDQVIGAMVVIVVIGLLAIAACSRRGKRFRASPLGHEPSLVSSRAAHFDAGQGQSIVVFWLHCAFLDRGPDVVLRPSRRAEALIRHRPPTPRSFERSRWRPRVSSRASAIACGLEPKVPRSILVDSLLDISGMVGEEKRKSAADVQRLLSKFAHEASKRALVL